MIVCNRIKLLNTYRICINDAHFSLDFNNVRMPNRFAGVDICERCWFKARFAIAVSTLLFPIIGERKEGGGLSPSVTSHKNKFYTILARINLYLVVAVSL